MDLKPILPVAATMTNSRQLTPSSHRKARKRGRRPEVPGPESSQEL